MIHALLRVKVEPAPLVRIPGCAVGLQAPVRQFQQVLLQRLETEGIGHLEVGALTIRALGINPELIVRLAKLRRLCIVLQGGRAEIAEHRVRHGRLHRQLVMRAAPGLHRISVAALALLLVHPLRLA